MSKVWENFESDSTLYLNSQFGKYASFIHMGKSDSTQADILVFGKDSLIRY